MAKNFQFEREVIGKNIHSVWTFCQSCGVRGINIPLNNECGNCGSAETITYYDAETIQNLLNEKPKMDKIGKIDWNDEAALATVFSEIEQNPDNTND